MKLLFSILSVILISLNLMAAEPKIEVLPGDWGDVPTANIAEVCRSAARELCQYFPDRAYDPISIQYDAKRGPMVIYGLGDKKERRVLLSSKETYWAQFAFQFSHEMCHILCNYRDGDKANQWFEESLCETASLFALRRMAETWKTKPPYSNWKSYGVKLSEYAEQRIKETDSLGELTLAQWYVRNEAELRKNNGNRKLYNVVAVAILPLLEKNPKQWRVVGSLNLGDAKKELTFKEYLQDWHNRAGKDDKPFVAEVAKKFAIDVK